MGMPFNGAFKIELVMNMCFSPKLVCPPTLFLAAVGGTGVQACIALQECGHDHYHMGMSTRKHEVKSENHFGLAHMHARTWLEFE
jgi:hypothetical protein